MKKEIINKLEIEANDLEEKLIKLKSIIKDLKSLDLERKVEVKKLNKEDKENYEKKTINDEEISSEENVENLEIIDEDEDEFVMETVSLYK